MKVLRELSEAQKARLPEIAAEWIEIGLNTDPCDFETAKGFVSQICEENEIKIPSKWELLDSPHAAKDYEFEHNGFGSMDAGWLSSYAAYVEFGIQNLDKLFPFFGLAKTCGFWGIVGDLGVLQHRPVEIHLQDNRLHNPNGASVLYRDGFAVWSIGGVRVDEQIVMKPETQSIQQIDSEQNEEIKRIRIERFTWQRYLTESNAKQLDKRRNDIEGTIEILYKTDFATVLVCACPSTADIYHLEVDPEVTSCKDAQLYLSGGRSGRIISAS